MYSMASERTDAVSVFPKGETSCWSAVILSPIFSFLTLNGGRVDEAASLLPLLLFISPPPFFAPVQVSFTSNAFFGFSSNVGIGIWVCREVKKLGLVSGLFTGDDAFQ
uniref:Uncharacterized protein n=1 Tax=Opuntia streptacantha TaxID=393608 RepID=A0A7C8YX43_OPUST